MTISFFAGGECYIYCWKSFSIWSANIFERTRECWFPCQLRKLVNALHFWCSFLCFLYLRPQRMIWLNFIRSEFYVRKASTFWTLSCMKRCFDSGSTLASLFSFITDFFHRFSFPFIDCELCFADWSSLSSPKQGILTLFINPHLTVLRLWLPQLVLLPHLCII